MKSKLNCLTVALIVCLYSNAQTTINDPEAQDYIYNANITDAKEKIAITKLFRALKYYHIWNNIHALYLPTGGTELSHSLNAKDPRPDEDAYPLIFPNGATHTNAGVSWNGVDQGAMSLYRATSTRLHLMVYQPEPANQPYIWSGDRNGITDYYSYTWSALYTNTIIGFANTSGLNYQNNEGNTGFFYGQRINHDSTEVYLNDNHTATWANEVSPYYNIDTSQFIWLNKSDQFADFLGTAGYSVASIGNVMESSKVKIYYQIIQAFLSELAIQTGSSLNWPGVPDSFETKITSNYRWHKATESAADTAIDGVHLYGIGDSLYLWGGWNGNYYPFDFNTGYVSGDGGSTWTKLAPAPWNARHSAAYGIDSAGNGYLIGSDFQPETTPENRKEVWKTEDGRNWQLITANAPWSENLILEGLAIKGNTLYVGGGQHGYNASDGLNDTIWKSSDGGRSWTVINTTASHLGGNLYNNFKYFKARNKFVAFCGGIYDNYPENRTFASQVWVSDDCITWAREKDVPFEARQYSDMVEWDNKLWVCAGGRPASSGNGSINLRGLWYMDENGEWHEAGSTPLPPRHASGLTVDKKNNRLVIACGNMHTDVWYVEKIGKGPEFELPLTKEVPLNNECALMIPDLSKDIQTKDRSKIAQFVQQPAAGTTISSAPGKSMDVLLKTLDASGNERNQWITLTTIDTIAPVFSIPDTVTVNLTADCKFSIPRLVDSSTVHENCGTATFSQFPEADSVINGHHGSIEKIQVRAADEYNNIRTKIIIVKAIDTIAPVFTCPATDTIYLSANCQTVIPDLISSINIQDCGTVNLKQIPERGTILNASFNSVYGVSIFATDENNNTTSCLVPLIIKDTSAPVFEEIEDLELPTDVDQCTASVSIPDPVLQDNCGITLLGNRSDSLALTAPYAIGKTIITWKAVDAAGNESTKTQTVTVTDNQLPIINVPSELSFCYDQNGSYTIPMLTAKDNCGIAAVRYTIDGATTREGNNNNANGSFNTGTSTITWTVTDIHGNEKTALTTIRIDEPLKTKIPDIYVLSQEANTMYIGYGPHSITLNASTTGGQAPYNFTWSNNTTASSINVNASSEGSYHYTVFTKDAMGCSDTASTDIKITDVRCDQGVLICSKKNNQTMTVCVPAGEVDLYLNDDSYLGSCKNVFATVALKDSIQVTTLPNPSTYSFQLRVQTYKPEHFSIRVFSNVGRLLERKDVTSDYIDMRFGENYIPGVYYVEITRGDQKKIVKLIKTFH